MTFEHLRGVIRDLLSGAYTPDARRVALAEMRLTIARARAAATDLREDLSTTEAKLAEERIQLETVARRRKLAARIADTDTVLIASRYEAMHAQQVAVLRQKIAAQQAELALLDAELTTMTGELKAATSGIGAVSTPGASESDVTEETDQLASPSEPSEEADRRAARGAEAEKKLSALKRRMGK
ncbi:MAG: hypothetical protein NVS4B3_02350 [Gemmatimonadaceae bacterium]